MTATSAIARTSGGCMCAKVPQPTASARALTTASTVALRSRNHRTVRAAARGPRAHATTAAMAIARWGNLRLAPCCSSRAVLAAFDCGESVR